MPNTKGNMFHKPFMHWSSAKQEQFLSVLRQVGVIRRALETVGSCRSGYYYFVKKNPEFLERVKAAQEEAAELLEEEALRRAKDGWEEPVWFQGAQVGTVRKFSDSLAMFLLKGSKPDKYRERQEHHHTGLPEKVTVYLPDNKRGEDD